MSLQTEGDDNQQSGIVKSHISDGRAYFFRLSCKWSHLLGWQWGCKSFPHRISSTSTGNQPVGYRPVVMLPSFLIIGTPWHWNRRMMDFTVNCFTIANVRDLPTNEAGQCLRNWTVSLWDSHSLSAWCNFVSTNLRHVSCVLHAIKPKLMVNN